jgi:hypothetical protein
MFISIKELKLGNDEAKLLNEISSKISNELKVANSRLKQFITPITLLFELKKAALNHSCIFLQPGCSNYAWSDRTIPVIFIYFINDKLRVRIRRSKSYRNSKVTPAVWPELRGFPGNNIKDKLLNFSQSLDGDLIDIKKIENLPFGNIDCAVEEWNFN